MCTVVLCTWLFCGFGGAGRFVLETGQLRARSRAAHYSRCLGSFQFGGASRSRYWYGVISLDFKLYLGGLRCYLAYFLGGWPLDLELVSEDLGCLKFGLTLCDCNAEVPV